MREILGMLVCLNFWIPFAEAGLQNGVPANAGIGQTGSSPATEQVDLQGASFPGVMNLSLQEAVRLALENNPTLKVEKIRVEQARSRINQQKGEFDPLFNSGSVLSHKDNIVASRFYPTGLYSEKQKAQTLGVETKTRTGGRVNLSLNYADLRSNSNIQTLSPQYSANLSFGVTQSLLRDFGRGIAETRLRVAEKGAAIVENNLFSRISQLIQRVEETYWNLTFLLQDLDGKLRSLASARQFLTQNENLLRAGRVAPVSVLQARAAVAERERDVVTSQTAADEYKDRLKNLLWLDLNTTDLTPVDSPDLIPVDLSADRSLQDALLRRPELRALQQEQEQRAIEVKYAANQIRPRLDLNVQFSLAGLSGKPNLTCLDPTSSICVPVGSNIAGSVLEGRTAVGDSLANLWSAHPYESWSVEVKFQLPIGNKTAKAQYSEASLRQLETNTNLVAMRDQVAIEIRNAIREAHASQKRIEASREALTYLENQLAGMRRQLEAGLMSSYDVLQAFEEVDKARTTELQAMMDFHVALSKVRLAEASGFQRYSIELVQPPRYTFDQPGIIK